ncbi:helix-turn-helix domain-containing protein [Leucobacter muris]|nr:helix-turn-helix transcriptional regulator [Leucobacter muris]
MEQKNATAGGEVLRGLRTTAGMTLAQVAEGAETSISYLSKVERGEHSPSAIYIGKVAAFIAAEILRESKAAA